MSLTHLQRAIDIAVAAHRNMEDPPGEPYILHPMRVMLRFADPELMTVAILHDTIERAGVTADDLRDAGLSEEVIAAVELLTHREGVSYADYVVTLKPNKLARPVKMADLQDNADLRHVDIRADKPRKSRHRTARYAFSYKFLNDELSEDEYRSLMSKAE